MEEDVAASRRSDNTLGRCCLQLPQPPPPGALAAPRLALPVLQPHPRPSAAVLQRCLRRWTSSSAGSPAAATRGTRRLLGRARCCSVAGCASHPPSAPAGARGCAEDARTRSLPPTPTEPPPQCSNTDPVPVQQHRPRPVCGSRPSAATQPPTHPHPLPRCSPAAPAPMQNGIPCPAAASQPPTHMHPLPRCSIAAPNPCASPAPLQPCSSCPNAERHPLPRCSIAASDPPASPAPLQPCSPCPNAERHPLPRCSTAAPSPCASPAPLQPCSPCPNAERRPLPHCSIAASDPPASPAPLQPCSPVSAPGLPLRRSTRRIPPSPPGAPVQPDSIARVSIASRPPSASVVVVVISLVSSPPVAVSAPPPCSSSSFRIIARRPQLRIFLGGKTLKPGLAGRSKDASKEPAAPPPAGWGLPVASCSCRLQRSMVVACDPALRLQAGSSRLRPAATKHGAAALVLELQPQEVARLQPGCISCILVALGSGSSKSPRAEASPGKPRI
ncbi:uncharacterized protein [Phaenicophaeus curvirostris]|uniref:uncharacterized protein n=1 Tax=Phaenicophaeus curvirostris TaxID=33595 RepID=UPI0037F0D22B